MDEEKDTKETTEETPKETPQEQSSPQGETQQQQSQQQPQEVNPGNSDKKIDTLISMVADLIETLQAQPPATKQPEPEKQNDETEDLEKTAEEADKLFDF